MAQDAGVKSIAELRQFGNNLNQASNALNMLFQQLTGQMHAIYDGWNDSKAAVLMAEIDQSKQEIEKISQKLQEFSAFVRKDCEILEQYENHRR